MQISRLSKILPITLLALSVTTTFSQSSAAADLVAQFPPRVVRHPAGQTGEGSNGGLIANIAIRAAPEYYLDYTLTFRPGFDWVPNGRPRGGKIPGLAGGSGTGGCRQVDPTGWSARQTWQQNGLASLYLYDQDRTSTCGQHFPYKDAQGKPFQFATGRQYRITERVQVNTPNVNNGEIQIWVDGRETLFKKGIRLRGKVSATQGMVSQLKYHSYFGGKGTKFAPSRDSYIDYGALYVSACMPDFARAPGACRR